jgi:hypothetical protein
MIPAAHRRFLRSTDDSCGPRTIPMLHGRFLRSTDDSYAPRTIPTAHGQFLRSTNDFLERRNRSWAWETVRGLLESSVGLGNRPRETPILPALPIHSTRQPV